jgi:hypothetical protein
MRVPTPSDYLGLVLFGGFGLWLAMFPNNVIRFYRGWFNARMGSPSKIRLIGVAWIIFVLWAFAFANK